MPPKTRSTIQKEEKIEQEIDIVSISMKDGVEILIDKTQTKKDAEKSTTVPVESESASASASATTNTAPVASTSSSTKEVSELLGFFDKLSIKNSPPQDSSTKADSTKTLSSICPSAPPAQKEVVKTKSSKTITAQSVLENWNLKPVAYSDQYLDKPFVPETVEMDGVLIPKPFTGAPGDNIESWMLHLLAYCEYKELPDKKRMELAVILMRDAASDWLQTQQKGVDEDGAFATFDELMNAAAKRFGRSDLIKHKTAKELFDTKQKADESVETYVAAQNKRAVYLGKEGESMALYAVLSGLKPQISTFVAQKQPKTMKELLEAARLAEITTVKNNDDASIIQKLAELQEEMKRMSSKFNTVTAIRPQSPDRRVSFRDQRSPSPRPDRTQRREYKQQPEWRPQQQQYGSNNYQPRPMQTRQQQPWSAPTRYTRQYQDQSGGQPECTRCARRHDNPQLCPAINQSCRYCSKMGHYMVKCRSWLRNCDARNAQTH